MVGRVATARKGAIEERFLQAEPGPIRRDDPEQGRTPAPAFADPGTHPSPTARR